MVLILGLILFSKPLFSQETELLAQTIRGQVVDKETQITLPAATVLILNTNPARATVTDSDGFFRIENVPIGRYDIQISFVGYKPFIISELQVTASKEIVLTVQLQEEAFSIETVTVKAFKNRAGTINSMATISARTFSAEETRRYAGGMDDPARMASAFAGVAVGNVQDNSIIIRGNSPKGVLWRLEGVEIPSPNHFAGANVAGGGFTTLFSNHLLSNSDFFTGAFPAEYGNALAGVFDIKLRSGNNERREYAFQAGVLGVDFAAEGPFALGKRASYIVNYRYSTFGLIKDFIPSEQIPVYQNLSFKLNFPLKGGGVLSLWGIGGNDNNSEPVTADSTQWTYNWDRVQYDLSTNVGAAGLTYKKIVSESAYIHSSIVASTNNFSYDMKSMNDNLVLVDSIFTNNTKSKYTFSTFINKKFSTRHTNRTGIILNSIFYNAQTKGRYLGDMIDYSNSSGNSYLFQAYTQSKYDIGPGLFLNLGVHAQYFHLNNEFSVEPRLGLKYAINTKSNISLGYGNHSQLEPLKVYMYQKESLGETILPNKNLAFSKAHHFVVAYDYSISPNLRLKIEPYYQYLYNIPVVANSSWSMINYEQEFTFDKTLINEGTGTNIGIDFTLERFLESNYYYLFTASLFDAKYTGGNGISYNSRFNKNFVLTALGGKEFVFDKKQGKTRILGINGRVSLMGGHRIVPIDEELSYQEREIYYDWTKPYQEHNPTDFFLDLTLLYRINKAKHSSIWILQLKNLTGTASNYMYQYNLRENKIEYTNQTVMVPVISYKIEF
ncbi:MAG: carboxypeptidase-like regulatory domain-containing protein [Bacteroidales bacterium]|nr:carboxypeptidase-like regulatory domain-containing protein [Bacteroidales bacterium]